MTYMPNAQPIPILMADDDPEDRLLARDALETACIENPLYCVEDGEDLLDFLHRRGRYADAPRPGLILLDLNMPRKGGLEALEEIRSDLSLRTIPVVILTTSDDDEDVVRSYDLGVNSFITKPASFTALVEAMQTLCRYWLSLVCLPGIPSDE